MTRSYCHKCAVPVITADGDEFCAWCDHPLSPAPGELPYPEVSGPRRLRLVKPPARLRLVERKDTV